MRLEYTGDYLARHGGVAKGRDLLDRMNDPALYIAQPALVEAVNIAITVRQPLLITGEPGCGKTQLAYSVSAELSARYPEEFHPRMLRYFTKSTSEAQELFYTFDAIARFQDAHVSREALDAGKYIELGPLGQAVVNAAGDDAHSSRLGIARPSGGRRRTVVLIDEIDKAPRDFPNDILNEIEQMSFVIRQLGNFEVSADPRLRPVVIITSNSEKHLPAPFLRRCIYFNIPFPVEIIQDIVAARVGSFATARAVDDSISLFNELRRDQYHLDKKPGIAELLTWIEVLREWRIDADESLRAHRDRLPGLMSVLLKSESDRMKGESAVENWLRSGNG